MTRKTPSPLLNELIVECNHMKVRRSEEKLHEEFSINYSDTGSRYNANKFYQLNSNNNSSLMRMTSFEELAKKSDGNTMLYIHETSVDQCNRQCSSNKPKSDYNICYNYMNPESPNEINYSNSKHQIDMKKSASHSYNIRRTERNTSSSDNSPAAAAATAHEYGQLKEKRKENRFKYHDEVSNGRPVDSNENSIKNYNRFFNSDDDLEGLFLKGYLFYNS